MPRAPLSAATSWSRDSLLAIVVAATALAAALGALLYARQSDRMIAEVELQTALAEAYQSRAIDCLDLARAWIDDPDRRQRAQMSLDMSKGITLCLVKARDEGRMDVGVMATCIREVEALNTVLEVGPGGGSASRPAC